MMTFTPKNLPTDTFLALCSTPAKVEMLIQVYDFAVRTWKTATDAAVIEAAKTAAQANLRPGLSIGDRLFIGDLLGSRVIVEVL